MIYYKIIIMLSHFPLKFPIIFQISFSCFMFLVNNFYGLFDYYLRIYVDTGYLNIDPMVWFVLWNSKDIMYLSYESNIYCLSFLKFYEMMYFDQFLMIWAGFKMFLNCIMMDSNNNSKRMMHGIKIVLNGIVVVFYFVVVVENDSFLICFNGIQFLKSMVII